MDNTSSIAASIGGNADLIVICIYFVIILLVVIFFVIYFWIGSRKEIELRVIERLNQQKAIENLVDNMKQQFSLLVKLPIKLKQFKLAGIVQTCSWLLLLILIGSVISLIVRAIIFNTNNQLDNLPSLKIETFLFVLCLNLYVISRQFVYYLRQQSINLHDPRYQALYRTNFNSFDKTWANYLQISVLGLEFFQLLSFPLQDIISSLTSKNSQMAGNSSSNSAIASILGIATLLPNISSSFFLVQFWTVMGVILLATVVAIGIHIYNERALRGIPLFWASNIVPIVNVGYLPILVTFINSVACFFQGEADQGFLKCSAKLVQPQLYIWGSLIGFTLAYILMTIFVTSYECKPIEGDIEFKSKGVAFIKNMSLLLTIDFSLIPKSYSKIKGIFSVIILTSLIIYNIHFRPCYVSQINFWRTAGFCCILWSALPVAILDMSTFPVYGVILLILIGWIVILSIFTFMKCIYQKS
jgi:hypothetical protein